MANAPVVEAFSTKTGKPGDALVIEGRHLEHRGSEVRFRLRDLTGAKVAVAPVGKSNPRRIEARVPALEALGSGGIADVWVVTGSGQSNPTEFTVREPSPPTAKSIDPKYAQPGGEATVTGTGFGLRPYGDAAVWIDAPAGPRATVLAWSPTSVRARLPTEAQLGGPGARRIRVHTLWGDSQDLQITIAAPPVVTGVAVPARPKEPPTFLPGDELVVSGTGFGARGPGSTVTLAGEGAPVALTVLDWQPTQIRFVVPVDASLGAPGPKSLVVTTPWGASPPYELPLEPPPSLEPGPLAMLPLRLETRFSDDRTELVVRSVPDAIHIDSHQDQLAQDERALGEAYNEATSAEGREDAWRRLVARTGRARALFVVEAAKGDPPAGGDPQERWTRAARTRLLPRRLYAFAYGDRPEPGDAPEPLATGWSRPIPFELPVGPDPREDPTDGELGEGIRWMTDVDVALEKGMAIRLRLPEELRTRIRRLVVVGAETALTAPQAASELATALRNQRHTGTLAFLPEGTPTNSTGQPTPGLDLEDAGRPPVSPDAPPSPESNAAWAMRALGFANDAMGFLSELPHAYGGSDLRWARRDMNRALWPLLRYFLDHMMSPAVLPGDEQAEPTSPEVPPGGEEREPTSPGVPPVAVEAGRTHFVEWVRACGPLPTLQVDQQPYGLLPITPLARLRLTPDNPLQGLIAFIEDTLRPLWLDSASNVPRVSDAPERRDGEATDHPLLTALSLQPYPLSYRARSILGADFAGAAWRFMGGDLNGAPTLNAKWWQAHEQVVNDDLGGLGWGPRLAHTVLATDYVPLAFPIAAQPDDPRDEPLQANFLKVLTRYGWQEVRDETYPPDLRAPRDPDAPPGSGAPLLYLVLRHSLLLAYAFAAGRAAGKEWRGEPEFYDIDEALDFPEKPRDAMIWEMFEGRIPPNAPAPADATELGQVIAGLRALEGLEVDRLERVTAEALSLCATRLDSWQTSFAARRLVDLRSAQPEGGVHLCAYGFVEDLEPAEARDSAGYIHAPSPAHASAAAILASGYRAHAGDDDGTGAARRPFGIDLSSERVRAALSLLEGVRAGQPLGALLGYRLERGLQERGVARFVAPLRERVPLPVAGVSAQSGAVTSVAAHNVVDGLELHRLWIDGGRKLPKEWPGASSSDVQDELLALDDAVDAIGDILVNEAVFQTVRGNAARARAALEAAARPSGPPPELEAIYTPYSGAGVIHRLLALIPGDWSPPPGWYEDDDRGRGHGEGHGRGHAEDEPPPELGVRASAEPRLDAWAGRLLGDPERVRFGVEYRNPDTSSLLATVHAGLDELRPALSPLDLVYAAVASEREQLSEIEQRIVYQALRSRPARVPADARVVIVDRPGPKKWDRGGRGKHGGRDDGRDTIGLLDVMELAQTLREAIVEATPVDASDLSVPEAVTAPAIDTSELTGRAEDAETALKEAEAELGAAIAEGAAEPLRAALLKVSGFGVPGAIPISAFGDSPADRADLAAQGAIAHSDVLRRVAALPAPLPVPPAGPPPVEPPPSEAEKRDHALARLAAVLGPAFRVLPLVSSPAASDPARLDVRFPDSEALEDRDPFAATTWFQRLTRVRDGARRLGDLLLYAEMLRDTDLLKFRVGQLPAVAGERWIGLAFGDRPAPAARLSIVAHLPGGPLEPAAPFAGLKFDELTEVLPAAERTTGLAVHYDQPNATAPQAILIGVPPVEGERWTLDLLRETAEEALDLAKIRMVDLPALGQAGHFLPALYFGLNLQGVTVATDFKEGAGERLA